jgi:sigma-B regulation protein RsbU (phosphoserine phosphatase)
MPASGPILSRIAFSPGAWTSRELTLQPGDLFFAYTDGLVEARRGDGQELGTRGLFDHLGGLGEPGGTAGPTSPEALLDEVFTLVERYSTGPASDDRTAVAVTRAPVASRPPTPAARQHTRVTPTRAGTPGSSG